MIKVTYPIGTCVQTILVRCDTVSYVNLNPTERRVLVEGILSSDVKHLDKLDASLYHYNISGTRLDHKLKPVLDSSTNLIKELENAEKD